MTSLSIFTALQAQVISILIRNPNDSVAEFIFDFIEIRSSRSGGVNYIGFSIFHL